MSDDRIARGKSIWRQAATGKFLVPPLFPQDIGIENTIGIEARRAQCFDVTNVSEYFFAGTDKNDWRYVEDIPCMVPPFPVTWLEASAPSALRVNGKVDQLDPSKNASASGVLIHSHKAGDIRNGDDHYLGMGDDFTKPHSTLGKFMGNCPDDGWLLEILSFVRLPEKGVMLWPFQYVLGLDVTGKPCTDMAILNNHIGTGLRVGNHTVVEIGEYGSRAIFVFGFALAFLHCKNVRVGELADERKPVDRARDLRAGIPEVKFKTLEIEPMRKVLVTEGGIAQNGLKKALHICRGHFSHYSADKPLFGKYEGQFWIPAHVRGTTESGQVIKDYKVKAPRERAA